MNTVALEVMRRAGTDRWMAGVRAVLNAGWTGRDAALVRAHVEEMRALGVPPPEEVPIVFPVSRAMLSQEQRVEIYNAESSGEVEYVLVAGGGRVAITVGSDHTDRKVEAFSIEMSKRLCPNVMARTAWEYADVADHVDDLVLRAWVREDGTWHPYQEAPIGTLLAPAYWLERIDASPGGEAVVLFSGTVPTIGGALRYGDGFRVGLDDPHTGRAITHEYDVTLVDTPLRR